MKKILSIILGAFLCAQAFAQINVNAGYLNANYRSNEDSYSYSLTGNGFYAGVSTDIKTNGQLVFEPGVNFNLSSYNFAEGIKTTEYFISAPLHFKYTYPVSNELDIFVSAGPTVLCTLGGRSKVSYGGMSYTEKEDGGDFDITLGFQGGIRLSNSIRLLVGYDFGLLNQSGESDYRVTRNFLHAGIGYTF